MSKIKIDLNNYKNYNFNFNYWETYENYDFSEQVIEKLQDKWNWDRIAIHQSLTESFIEKHQDKFEDWDYIAIHQSLTESFIEKFQDKFEDWDYIARYQSLTEPFRNKYLNEYQKKLYKEFHPNEKENNVSTSSNKSNKYNSNCYKCGSETIIWDIGFGSSNYKICPKCKE